MKEIIVKIRKENMSVYDNYTSIKSMTSWSILSCVGYLSVSLSFTLS